MNHKDDSVEKLAWVLDEAFPVPGTRFRFGWDAIIGLVPGIGETITLFAQAGVVLLAVGKYEVPFIVALRMIWNVLLDGVIGSLPFFGDIFDFFFKANTKNVKLLREVQAEQAITGSVSRRRHYLYFGVIALILSAVMALVITLVVLVLRFLWGLLQQGQVITVGLALCLATPSFAKCQRNLFVVSQDETYIASLSPTLGELKPPVDEFSRVLDALLTTSGVSEFKAWNKSAFGSALSKDQEKELLSNMRRVFLSKLKRQVVSGQPFEGFLARTTKMETLFASENPRLKDFFCFDRPFPE